MNRPLCMEAQARRLLTQIITKTKPYKLRYALIDVIVALKEIRNRYREEDDDGRDQEN